jgi:Fic family protein
MPVNYHEGQFPPADLNWRLLIPLIGKGNAALARYDGLLTAIPNAHVLLSPLATQEAVLSSKIEGTQVTMGEVLEVEAGGEPEGLTQPRREDIEEVLNYRKALMFCAKALMERPLSLSLIKEAHALLMRGVRGSKQAPGRFRVEQNWIGPKDCSLDQASFVPIAPEHLQVGMEAWMSYVNDTDQPDPLVQLALAHLEFEALHPFKDGNGRLGRMLIPLFLYQRRLLSGPDFYMSAYLEANRERYQERLRAVSRDGAWSEWVAFFLEGVIEQASENEHKARAILALYEQVKGRVVELTHSQYAIHAVDFVFRHPIFAAPHFVSAAQIPKPTAMRILNVLREGGLLSTLREGRGRRFGVYAFRELLNRAEGRSIL